MSKCSAKRNVPRQAIIHMTRLREQDGAENLIRILSSVLFNQAELS